MGLLRKSERTEIEHSWGRGNLQKARKVSVTVTKSFEFVSWCLSGRETNHCVFMTGDSDVQS